MPRPTTGHPRPGPPSRRPAAHCPPPGPVPPQRLLALPALAVEAAQWGPVGAAQPEPVEAAQWGLVGAVQREPGEAAQQGPVEAAQQGAVEAAPQEPVGAAGFPRVAATVGVRPNNRVPLSSSTANFASSRCSRPSISVSSAEKAGVASTITAALSAVGPFGSSTAARISRAFAWHSSSAAKFGSSTWLMVMMRSRTTRTRRRASANVARRGSFTVASASARTTGSSALRPSIAAGGGALRPTGRAASKAAPRRSGDRSPQGGEFVDEIARRRRHGMLPFLGVRQGGVNPAGPGRGGRALLRRDAEHFLERGHALEHFQQAGLAERLHALLRRDVPDLVDEGAGEDEATDLGRRREDLVERDPPLHPGEVARVAAPTLVERTPPDAEGRVAVRDQELLVGFVGLAALLADLARQPLRDDEAERRREEERRNAHIRQPRDALRGAVRVERAQHEVPGQGRPDRDLSRLLVAHLADEDDVGVVAQERAEGRGEGAADLVADLDLRRARQLVLHGVLDGHDVPLLRVERVERRVEGGGLARAGRPGDDDQAVRRADRLLEVPQRGRLEPELGQVSLQRLLVEESEHDALADDRREDRDPEIDLARLLAELDASVLRQAPLGAVEVRHDLEARDERRLDPLGRRHHFVQDAVDPVPDPLSPVARVDVDVGGPPLHPVEQDRVHQPDDGHLVGRRPQLVEVDLTVRLLALDDLDLGGLRLDLRERVRDRQPPPLVVALDRLPDDRRRRDGRHDLETRHEGDVIERRQVGRVPDGQRDRAERPADRDEAVLARDPTRDHWDGLGGDPFRERDLWDAVVTREEMDQPVFGDQPEADQDLAELLARSLLLAERLIDLRLCDQAVGDEQIAEAPADRRLARATGGDQRAADLAFLGLARAGPTSAGRGPRRIGVTRAPPSWR